MTQTSDSISVALPEPDLATAAPRGWTALCHSRWFLLVILLLWAGAYLPNLGLRDLRLEEGRRATPAAEMLASGHWALPTLAGDPYFNKPPLFFWLIAACGWLFGHVNAWAARLPAVLSLLGSAYLLLGFAQRDLPRSVRALAALMLLACPVMIDKGAIAEIDTFLSLLVAASWAAFWNGYRPAAEGGQRLRSWLLIGALQAVAVLAKAPGGPAEFYVPVILFLLWERQLKRLFSWGHLLCIAIYLAPTLLWVVLLVQRGQFPLGSGLANWVNQLGFNTLAVQQAEPDETVSLRRYLFFPVEVFLMTFPWTGWTIASFVPAVRRGLPMPPSLWRFLASGVAGLTAVFWLWPSAHPRHMMAVVFPMCLLAAAVGVAFWQKSAQPRYHAFCRQMALGPLLVALVALVLTYTLPLHQATRLHAFLLVAGCLAASSFLAWIARRQAGPDTTLGILASLIVVALCGRATAMITVYARQAEKDAIHVARVTLQRQLDAPEAAGLPLYTTRTFPGRGDDYYNVQFYLAPRLRGLHAWSELPGPAIVLMTPAEVGACQISGRRCRVLGAPVPVKGGKPNLVMVRVEPPEKTTR